jgi:hypothetical protein
MLITVYRGDTSQGSDVGFLKQNHQTSEDHSRDRDFDSSSEVDKSAEPQEDGYDRNDKTSTSNSRSMRHEGFPRSSR